MTTNNAKTAIAPGLYVLGALVGLSLADTAAGPVVLAFTAAAVLYNANQIFTVPLVQRGGLRKG